MRKCSCKIDEEGKHPDGKLHGVFSSGIPRCPVCGGEVVKGDPRY